MVQYLIRRIIQMVPLLLVISIITFSIMYLSPGDPVYMYVNPHKAQLTEEALDALRHELGLDQPIHVQYLSWLSNIFKGDWGYSFATKLPVSDELMRHVPNSLMLGGSAIFLAILIAIPIGTISAIKRYSLLDYLATTGAFIGLSLPSFWFAMIMIQVFSNQLGWLPSVGMKTMGVELSGWAGVVDQIKHLIMPTIVLSMIEMSYWTRYQRSSLLEVLGQDYIRTARSKGVREKVVIVRHAIRNALGPVITLAGMTLPELITGSYIVETIFAWPGMGRLGVKAILSRDYPVVMGVTMVSSLLVVAGSLFADLGYALVDPRIRFE